MSVEVSGLPLISTVRLSMSIRSFGLEEVEVDRLVVFG